MRDEPRPRHPYLPHPAFTAATFSLPAAFDHQAIVSFVSRGDYACAIGESASFALLGDEDSSPLSAHDYRQISTLLDALYSALRSQDASDPAARQ